MPRLTDKQLARVIATRSRGCYCMDTLEAVAEEAGLLVEQVLDQVQKKGDEIFNLFVERNS
jgi:hypothetical protein